MSKYLTDPSTILVLAGKPYRLVREIGVTKNNPCHLCELTNICKCDGSEPSLLPLCMVGNKSGAWFFKENRDCVNHRILEYVEFNAQYEILDF